MAISKKNKRKIKYKGQRFLWWVNNDFDGSGNMLSVSIASEDKKFLIKYFAVGNNPADSHLSVIGQYFPGLETKTGNDMKLSCPDFSSSFVENAVTPGTIKEILNWCFDRSLPNQNTYEK